MMTSDTPRKRRPKWLEPGSKVTRKTRATVYSRGARAVIVTLYPDGVIGLRLTKHRREENVDAADVYRRAVAERVAIERAQRRKRK